ncbi:MAG TPA: tetratricopeptide repeat protein [Methyloceanibacter sp.]|jgi:tetratricopeptide (TPR) repeat protein|nr:tetratricopeptide repeat protein [Methyloceanibacter sp.]
MESFTSVFPLDWTTFESVLAILGVLAVLLGLFAWLARWALRKDQALNRLAAEQIAVSMAGKMASRSQEDGDRFSLKESNSIKSLIADAVLALGAENSKPARRAIAKLKAASVVPANEIFAEIAQRKRGEAEQAASEAASALRHHGALLLPTDMQASLDFFQRAFELDPTNPENLLALALVHFRLGDIPSVEALIDRAQVGGDQAGRSGIAGLIDMFAGVLHLRRGRYAEAIEKFDGARSIFEARGDARSLVDALMALASAQMKAGSLDAALANYNKAAAICNEANYEVGLAQLYADLGLLLQSLGKPYEAEQMLLKSFSLADKLGEISIASVAVGNLALLYRETQNFDRAEEMLRQALQLEERLRHKDGIARANINLGTVLFEKARYEEAAGHFKESLRLYDELGLPELASQAAYNLGNAHRSLKQAAQAETYYRKAIDFFMSANDASGVAKAAGNLGAVYLDIGRLAEAEEEFNIALDAAREAGEGRAIAMQMRNLAVLAHMKGQPERACQGLRESLALCMEIDARTEALELKVLMGQIGCQ